MNLKYNESPYRYSRRKTREVKVGDVGIGGENPIRIQSMTNSFTKDVAETIRQIRELQEAGCEIVRLTVPTSPDAEALPLIRQRMKEENLTVPLVADIHFTPSIAMKSVEYVDKVRINPGNFADRKKFEIIEYTDSAYKEELDRIYDAFSPLVIRAKELGVAMRIGTNHGSLSDRIMNRFGDTPEGMVESALEFIRIAESHGYRDIIVSMKASNTQVMVQAYRLLVSRFYELGMDYPLHLGVTEAGDGRDGRIKSSIGIGSLLDDGLGDTIRVSLTEDPVAEIPVARKIAERYNQPGNGAFQEDLSSTPPPTPRRLATSPQVSPSEASVAKEKSGSGGEEFRNPFTYSRFYSRELQLGKDAKAQNPDFLPMGDKNPIRVEYSFPRIPEDPISAIGKIVQESIPGSIQPESLHFTIRSETEISKLAEIKKTGVVPMPISFLLQGKISTEFYDYLNELVLLDKWATYLPYFTLEGDEEAYFSTLAEFHKNGGVIEWILRESDLPRITYLLELLSKWNLKSSLFSLETEDMIRDYRKLAVALNNSDYPFLLSGTYENYEEALYSASIGMGGLLLDGIGDMVRIQIPGTALDSLSLSYDILQGARLRLNKTEYISCPSCGRTLFDLQETTQRIKRITNHLKGVKIAVMGCIVNGPGEMADADFGYVGAAPGKVHLYKGKEIVMKNVPEDIAPDKLVELIKENGMWVEAEYSSQ